MRKLKAFKTCTKCRLHEFRRHVILGNGDIPADVLFIGEAPGKSEDLVGKPFVGPAGRILQQAVEAATERISWKKPPSYYITNTVSCRPTDKKRGDNRSPMDDELLACRPRLLLIERLVKPRTIILMGNVAKDACIGNFPDAHCTRHPSFVLRRGGTESTEYRHLVRDLMDAFKETGIRRLFPRKQIRR